MRTLFVLVLVLSASGMYGQLTKSAAEQTAKKRLTNFEKYKEVEEKCGDRLSALKTRVSQKDLVASGHVIFEAISLQAYCNQHCDRITRRFKNIFWKNEIHDLLKEALGNFSADGVVQQSLVEKYVQSQKDGFYAAVLNGHWNTAIAIDKEVSLVLNTLLSEKKDKEVKWQDELQALFYSGTKTISSEAPVNAEESTTKKSNDYLVKKRVVAAGSDLLEPMCES